MRGCHVNLWIQAGVTLHLNSGEAAFLLSERLRNQSDSPADSPHAIVTKAIQEGRFTFGGEFYIPWESVEAFNRENDTDYDPKDTTELQLNELNFVSPGWKEVSGTILVITYTDGKMRLIELDPGQNVQNLVSFLNGQEMGAGRERVVKQVQRINTWIKELETLYI